MKELRESIQHIVSIEKEWLMRRSGLGEGCRCRQELHRKGLAGHVRVGGFMPNSRH